jgi:hypothetical protein
MHPLFGICAVAILGAVAPAAGAQTPGGPLPDPPRQRDPWTPPPTKLPESVVSATSLLFEQGMADPRGCAYHDVEVNDGQIRSTRGFVLPARPGQTDQFFVSWEGMVCRARSVGARADFENDIRTLASVMARDREAARAEIERGTMHDDQFMSTDLVLWPSAGTGPGPGRRSPLKVCVLLRLGRSDLAETLFAAGTDWTAERDNRGVTDGSSIDYLALTYHWAAEVFLRLMYAHMRGDDATALDAARRLTGFATAVDTKLGALGFGRVKARRRTRAPANFPFLRQLPELLADQERRAREPGRPPLPKRTDDQGKRITGLIRALDQLGDPQLGEFGGSDDLREAPLVKALVSEGDAAVDQLLRTCENDPRLTRSVFLRAGRSTGWTAQHVHEAAFAALEGILQTTEFHYSIDILRPDDLAGRRDLVQSMRASWDKNHSLSLPERSYRTLKDDNAGLNRWLESAENIVSFGAGAIGHTVERGGSEGRAALRTIAHSLAGEELRSRRDPSVSELLTRRVTQLVRADSPPRQRDIGFASACRLALALDRWDETAALPLVKSLMARCRAVSDLNTAKDYALDDGLPEFMSRFTLIRTRLGGRDGLGEYATWIRTTIPGRMGRPSVTCLEPMWTHPDDAAIIAASRWLWSYSESPWTAMLHSPKSSDRVTFGGGNLYASPLLRVAGFRAGLQSALGSRSLAGTLTAKQRGVVWYKMADGQLMSVSTAKSELKQVAIDVDTPFRVCDYIAWQISSFDGAPECVLYWAEDRRDRAVAACAEFLKRYGNRITAGSPDCDETSSGATAHLAFPALGRPATVDDVKQARAIFSLEPRDARLAKVPKLPVPARWVTLVELAYDRQNPDGTISREYDQDGWIWQAEEIRKGDRWLRYYGFVGRHTIARVPAPEIEQRDHRAGDAWGRLSGGMDARIEPVEPSSDGYRPGRPITVVLWLRNRLGTEHTAPTEFFRANPGKSVAIRRGVTLKLFASRASVFRTGHGPVDREEELTPKRTQRFEPGTDSRSLEAFEKFEAARFDLTDAFDLLQPGSYRLRIASAAESGIGEGASSDWHFKVVSPDEYAQ